jgi:hypothetical protein
MIGIVIILYGISLIVVALGLSCIGFMIWNLFEASRYNKLFKWRHEILYQDRGYAYKVMKRQIFIRPKRIKGKRKILELLQNDTDIEYIIDVYYKYDMP